MVTFRIFTFDPKIYSLRRCRNAITLNIFVSLDSWFKTQWGNKISDLAKSDLSMRHNKKLPISLPETIEGINTPHLQGEALLSARYGQDGASRVIAVQ